MALAKSCLGPVNSLEEHLQDSWWIDLFDQWYLKTDGDVVEDPKITEDEVATILESVDMPVNATVLDLCCGQGRHSLQLASVRKDVTVVGVDQSEYLISLAKQRATQAGLQDRTQFYVSDCRKLEFLSDSHFDVVIVMGNSFGYFSSESADDTVLQQASRVLKPGGQILLDLTDGDFMKKNFAPRSWEWIDQDLFVCRERQLAKDDRRLISREIISSVSKGVVRDQFYAERLYTEHEMQLLLSRNGFKACTKISEMTGEQSQRGQDLGMMEHRMLIRSQTCSSTATEHLQLFGKHSPTASLGTDVEDGTEMKKTNASQKLVVIMGDPSRGSSEKLNQQWNQEDLITVENAKKALSESLSHHYSISFLSNHDSLMGDLSKLASEGSDILVLNLCDEGYFNHARLELHVPALLDTLNIPYTGAQPPCLAVCYDKAVVNATAAKLGVEVPVEVDVNLGSITQATLDHMLKNFSFPGFIKPSRGDGSVGITQESIVNNVTEAYEYLQTLKHNPNVLSDDVVIQEYLQGAEVSVGIIGNPKLKRNGEIQSDSAIFLPILQVDFTNLPDDLPAILSYESKWDPSSPYWTDIAYKECPFLTEEEKTNLYTQCTRLFNRFECQDYARFDFRRNSKTGAFKLLEVNPNPGWCWDGKLALMAGFAKMSYGQMLSSIVEAAKERVKMS